MARKTYPWSEWFGRRRFFLQRGLDYHCSSIAMAQQVRNEAVKRGISIVIDDWVDKVGASGLEVRIMSTDTVEEPA